MTTTRSAILDALAHLWRLYPHWRFGQLVDNAALWAKGTDYKQIENVEDHDLVQGANEHCERRCRQLGISVDSSTGELSPEQAELIELLEQRLLENACGLGRLLGELMNSAGVRLYDVTNERLMEMLKAY